MHQSTALVRVAALGLVFLLVGIAAPLEARSREATPAGLTDIEANKAVVDRFWAAVNAGDVDALDEVVAADFVDRRPLPGTPPDREGLKLLVAQFHAVFPDAQWVVEDMVAEGDKVAVRVTFRGTHEGELFGVPPTGQQVDIAGLAIYRVANGQVTDEWAVRDLLGLMQQIGAIPAPESPETPAP